MKAPPKDITFHYTNEQMVKDLIALIPYGVNDSWLDAGSGKNKVWYKNFPVAQKFECELEDGNDFYNYVGGYDWVVGNPPFHEGWKFLEKASQIPEKGMSF